MTWETFLKSMELGNNFVFGGGEPTIHPLFEKMLKHAVGLHKDIWLATNGSQTNVAITLAEMARTGIIGCVLSQDYWHDPIDPKVVEAFTRKPDRAGLWPNDKRGINNVTKLTTLISAGRASSKFFFWPKVESCCCNTLFIAPDGKVHQCGCHDSPVVGSVYSGFSENWEPNCCYKDLAGRLKSRELTAMKQLKHSKKALKRREREMQTT